VVTVKVPAAEIWNATVIESIIESNNFLMFDCLMSYLVRSWINSI